MKKELGLGCVSKYAKVVSRMKLLRKKMNSSLPSSLSDRNCKPLSRGNVILVMTFMKQTEDIEIVQDCSWFYSIGLSGLCFSP